MRIPGWPPDEGGAAAGRIVASVEEGLSVTMRWNHSSSAAVLVAAAVATLFGAVAFAQSEGEAAGEDAPPGVLGEMLGVRSEGNEAAEAAQREIDVVSDETSQVVAEYRTALKQIDAIDLYNGQMRNLIQSQEAELESLAGQLDRVEAVGRSVTPLMMRMIDTLEKFVELDVPFLAEERAERVQSLRETMNRADVSTAGKFRQIMEAYQIENEYGRTIEAYRSTLDLDGRETRVDFLRFGRIALVFQSLDETQAGVWDQESRSWKPLDSSHRSAIRAGLRIARKQSAPDLIRLPLPAASAPRGES